MTNRWFIIIGTAVGIFIIIATNMATFNGRFSDDLQPIATTMSRDRSGDGCYHVFIDAGSNRGVHGRFLFEPEKYPKAKFTAVYDKHFGTNRKNQPICVFAFEPNPKHMKNQLAIEKSYNLMGWRYRYIQAAVSDADGTMTFYRNIHLAGGLKGEDTSFSLTPRGDINLAKNHSVTVKTIDLAKWFKQNIESRRLPKVNPNMNLGKPKLVMKMDIESAEFRTLTHLLARGVACQFDEIVGEPHFYPEAIITGGGVNLSSTELKRKLLDSIAFVMQADGCKPMRVFDDEEYLHDGAPLPQNPESDRKHTQSFDHSVSLSHSAPNSVCTSPPLGTAAWSCTGQRQPYDSADIKRTGGNLKGGNLYRPMWRMMGERLGIKSVLDVGAGLGEAVEVFSQDLGWKALGIDGSVMNTMGSERQVILHDMKYGPFVPGVVFDLCWSCFVLEHIDEPFLHNVLNTFKSCRNLAVAIGMNKNGHHHVTIHPWEPWWDAVFAQFGFEVDTEHTALSRQPKYGTEERRKHTWWSGGENNHAPGKILRNRVLREIGNDLDYYRNTDWTQRVSQV